MHTSTMARWLAVSSLVLGAGCSAHAEEDLDTLGSATAALEGPTPIIMTEKGPVQGTYVGSTRAYLGIPYARAKRFKSPRPVSGWGLRPDGTAEFGATRGFACPQLAPVPSPIPGTSEDCLNLNIWAPAGEAVHDRSVIVWIHGGGFQAGSGGEPQFDGKALSEASGAVVVTINYRLGALGFLAHQALRTEDPAHPSSGMYGIEDQRAALAWVRDNIAAFGGDPTRVTLAGHSAGAMSVCFHMASPLSSGLFHRAIMESSGCWLGPSTTPQEAEAKGNVAVAAAGCAGASNVAKCLRDTDVNNLLVALPPQGNFTPQGLSWWPHIDGWNLPENPETRLRNGNFNVVPTLLGSNRDEGTPFTRVLGDRGSPSDANGPFTGPPNGLIDWMEPFPAGADPAVHFASKFAEMMNAHFPGHGEAIAGEYLTSGYATPTLAVEAAIADGIFICPTRRTARAISQTGANTYLYQFANPTSTPLQFFFGLGAFHAAEIPFVFGNGYPSLLVSLSAAEQQLSAQMMGYWSRLAEHENPNGQGALAWERYETETDRHMVLDLQPTMSSGLRASSCEFWDSLVP